eukprot:Colp12_sorted_trinity150504_noHs@31097
MPGDSKIQAKSDTKPKWGDEEAEDGLPATQVIGPVNGIKKVIEYRLTADGVKEKVTKTFRVQNKATKIPKAIIQRRQWKKFGNAGKDKAGVDPATTRVGEDVFLQLTSKAKDLDEKPQDDDPLKKLANAKIVVCRICKGEHWTTKCPYKDTLSVPQVPKDEEPAKPAAAAAAAAPAATTGGKYVPPNLRDAAGARRSGGAEPPAPPGRRNKMDDNVTIRCTNLSEDTREADVQDLFKPFGHILRVFLAKDKVNNQSKGFAFISFSKREEAQAAIDALDGYGYDHLILRVEWAKPAAQNA